MNMTVPGTIPAESLRAWFDEHLVDDVALYDITAQAATSLSALLVKRQLTASDDLERERWAVRVRLVVQQQTAINPDDRPGLIAQQQEWLDAANVLIERAPLPA